MESIVNYLYKIDIENKKEYADGYVINWKNNYYFLCKTENINEKTINYINKINFINSRSFFCYKYIKNIYNEYISKIEDEFYVLLEIDAKYNEEIDFLDMLDFYKKSSLILNNQNFNINWDILWENKINFLLDHLDHTNVLNKNIIPYFYYYIGLSENALLYVKKLKSSSLNKSLYPCFVHRRVVDNTKLSFLNPMRFLTDIKERDIASYIKNKYYNKEDYLTDLDYYLKVERLTTYEASLLYIRIVYPSIFLDYFENHQEKSKLKDRFNPTFYEEFIKKTYELINSYVQIEKISWL